MNGPLTPDLPAAGPPQAGDPAAAARGLERWPRAVERLPPELADAAAAAMEAPGGRRLLEAVFGNSPFLSEALLAEPDVLALFLRDGPDPTRDALLKEADAATPGQRARVAAALRRSRRRMALLVALADLAGAWPLEAVTGALTAFADRCIGRALAQALREAADRGEVEPDDHHPDGGGPPAAAGEQRCGVVVLGMGKLGAFELNYSSDVDLIVLFDPRRLRTRLREGPLALSVRLTRTLVHVLEARTKDGYVFRTDLRLRPHPAGQPLALAVDDALFYYEHHGQNWERAALIKARPVAGDVEVGAAFLRQLRPFLWRKHLDYAAIADIQSIKRQINAHRGHGAIKVLGHDVKVGRGGIREIEFFAQTQQLILGGRVPELRVPDTCGALGALVATRWLAPEAADQMIAAYRFLRRVEHRLQMVHDRQTHRLPERPEQLERFAAFMGFAGGAAALDRALHHHLGTVERHYASLFETSPDLGAGGRLVFTGVEDDAGTLATLAEMGFARPEAVARRLREWHHGHIRATRSARARELLTELAPGMLRALAAQAEPDAAFERFDAFVSSLPQGVQPFSLFRANPRLLDLVSDLMGSAPRLGETLRFDASLFEAMLAPDLMEPLPGRAALAAELERALAEAADLQDALDLARRWLHRRQFQAGLQLLLGVAFGDRAGATLSDLAELVIRALLPAAARWLARQHGAPPPESAFVVLGLGKLGSRELTIGSDLDLIFVYDAPEDAHSQGERPLAAGAYFARLGQRLVSALTAQTPEGRLYDIDTRLRPSGNVGPAAISAENFARYQRETAQTWEHQALTRARVVAAWGGAAGAGDALAGRVAAILRAELTRPRDPAALGRDVACMRARIFREHGDDDPWNLKHARGGLVDAEFIAQLVQLRHAAAHPEILRTNTAEALAAAGRAGVLPAAEAEALVQSVRLHQRLQAVLRLSVSDRFVPADAPRGLREALCRAAAAGGPPVDFGHLERDLRAAQASVRHAFDRLCAVAADEDGAREAPR